MKKVFTIAVALIILLGGYFAYNTYILRQDAQAAGGDLETIAVENGSLVVTTSATGTVRSDQSASLTWETSGIVDDVLVELEEHVSIGQVLASLEVTSLPQQNILAQADLVEAQRALENLLNSQTQGAQAQKAVEDAQQALEDALNPELSQANLRSNIAAAQKTVDEAQSTLEILTTPVSEAAIDQTYANMLLAENVLNNTKDEIARIEKKLKKPEEAYIFFESREFYSDILENLETKLVRDQRSYEDAVEKYEDLLEPPNPNDVAVAEANLTSAQAQLALAERDWEREVDGPSQAELAVLQAELENAHREMERLQDGPDPDDIAAAEARVAAAQAALDQVSITAPFDGTITGVTNQTGDQVTAGTLALQIDDLSQLYVDLEVSEVDINQVELGQQVTLTFDAIPGKEYHGEVIEVALAGTETQGVVNFYVTVELKDADEKVKPGISAAASIITAQLDETLLVPNRAMRVVNGERVVYKLSTSGDFQPTQIKLGASSDTHSQVIDGDLQAGDLILLNPTG